MLCITLLFSQYIQAKNTNIHFLVQFISLEIHEKYYRKHDHCIGTKIFTLAMTFFFVIDCAILKVQQIISLILIVVFSLLFFSSNHLHDQSLKSTDNGKITQTIRQF